MNQIKFPDIFLGLIITKYMSLEKVRIENYTDLRIIVIGKLDVLESHQYKVEIKR